jgi:hypothetical protein
LGVPADGFLSISRKILEGGYAYRDVPKMAMKSIEEKEHVVQNEGNELRRPGAAQATQEVS